MCRLTDGRFRLVQMRFDLWVARGFATSDRHVAENGRERIVEVVGDATGVDPQ